MSKKDFITVYWSPVILPEEESWSFYYRNPTPVLNPLRKIQNKSAKDNFFSCPSVTDLFSNVYRVDCPIDLEINLNKEDMESPYDTNLIGTGKDFVLISNDSKISLYKHRLNILDNYMTCILNLRWIFFADEPLTIRFTPPYFPSIVPAEGTLLASGEFDIGKWYRPILLDYHFPVKTEKLSFKENDPLFFIEFKTEKNIIFKRYHMSEKLLRMKDECMESPNRYGRYKTLKQRYLMASKSNFSSIVLTEIKKNLVDDE